MGGRRGATTRDRHTLAMALVLAAAGAAIPVASAAQATPAHDTTASGVPYTITLPAGYDAAAPSPLLLFLHGGDRSNTRHHPAKYAVEEGIEFPFIVIAPHCRGGCRWPAVDFDELLTGVTADFAVDRSRIYLTGYSMGGIGSWDLLSRNPEWFAAAAPIAGGGSPGSICPASNVAVRAYHGDQDDVIAHARSVEMVEALQACGGNATLMTLPGVDHGSWIPTFKDPAFYTWLLEQRKRG